MSAHTPGPWCIEKLPNAVGDALEPAVMDAVSDFYVATAHDFGDDGATSRANAHLIAAAPELLAALERLAAVWERLGPPNTVTISGGPTAIEQARAAIAKARGGK